MYFHLKRISRKMKIVKSHCCGTWSTWNWYAFQQVAAIEYRFPNLYSPISCEKKKKNNICDSAKNAGIRVELNEKKTWLRKIIGYDAVTQEQTMHMFSAYTIWNFLHSTNKRNLKNIVLICRAFVKIGIWNRKRNATNSMLYYTSEDRSCSSNTSPYVNSFIVPFSGRTGHDINFLLWYMQQAVVCSVHIHKYIYFFVFFLISFYVFHLRAPCALVSHKHVTASFASFCFDCVGAVHMETSSEKALSGNALHHSWPMWVWEKKRIA